MGKVFRHQAGGSKNERFFPLSRNTKGGKNVVYEKDTLFGFQRIPPLNLEHYFCQHETALQLIGPPAPCSRLSPLHFLLNSILQTAKECSATVQLMYSQALERTSDEIGSDNYRKYMRE